MTPQEFKNIWTKTGGKLSPLAPKRLARFKLLPSTAEFLTTSGLPTEAAPYISFAQDIDDMLYGINKLTEQYDFLEPQYEKFIVIGSCGDGDPIAINTNNSDQIEWLDHEDYFSARFFNSSIHALAACLVAYREFILAVQKENGEDAFMNANFSDDQFEKVQQDINAIDSRALIEDSFWKEELGNLIAYRKHERNNLN